MIGGHAQYAKGYVEETVGKAIGSKDWEESGKKDSASGIEEMKVRDSIYSYSSESENANPREVADDGAIGGRC